MYDMNEFDERCPQCGTRKTCLKHHFVIDPEFSRQKSATRTMLRRVRSEIRKAEKERIAGLKSTQLNLFS